MDIHKWLAETVQAKAPPQLVENPSIKPSRRPAKLASGTKERRRQKQSRSDSSLLDLHLQPEGKLANKRRRSIVEISDDDDDGAESDASHATCSELSKSNISSQRYARQPRRKTRSERYQPLSKAIRERGKHAHQSQEGESKKSRRKSKRRKGEKQGSGIVQSFHAKNVSGDRLTLKPQEQFGIFNKGKTSRAIKGRGLPDLVFSEMKFLQKQDDLPGSTLQPEKSGKKHKNDRAQAKEGEISAFFTAVRSSLLEKVGQSPATKFSDIPGGDRCGRERSSATDTAMPTVEIANKGLSLRLRSRDSRRDTSSYVSWSDSNPAASTTPRQRRTKRGAYNSQLDPLSCKENKTVADHEEPSFQPPALPSPIRQGSDRTPELFRVSSLAPTHNRLSRSCSYPPQTSSPRRVNLVDRNAKLNTSDSISSPSSMPPFVSVNASVVGAPVQTRVSPRSGVGKPSHHRQSVSFGEQNNTNMHPNTSSDLGRVVKECNNTFSKRRQAAPRGKHTVRLDPAYYTTEPERQVFTNSYPIIQQIPTVRFVGGETHASPMTNFAGPSIYEQQAQREQLPLRSVAEESAFLDPYPFQEDYLDGDDDIDCGNLDGDELIDEPISYSLQTESRLYGVGGAFPTGDGVQQSVAEIHVVAPGFWRPNRLY